MVCMYRIVLPLCLLLLLPACKDLFQYSPYQANMEQSNLLQAQKEALAKTSTASFTPFSFAIFSDTHDEYHLFSEAIEQTNRDSDVQFVVHAGDLTNFGLLKEYNWAMDTLSSSRAPYLTVIGNHDALGNGKVIYRRMLGEYNYSVVYRNVKLIFLNNNDWEFDNLAPDNDWLAQELSDSSLYQHVIVVCHIYPFYDRFTTEEQSAFRRLVKDNFVSLVVSGHGHNYSYTTEILSNGGTIGYLVAGATPRGSFNRVIVGPSGVDLVRVSF